MKVADLGRNEGDMEDGLSCLVALRLLHLKAWCISSQHKLSFGITCKDLKKEKPTAPRTLDLGGIWVGTSNLILMCC